jgi:fructosamine-3-kinase
MNVVKERADAPPGFFEAEAAGLAWLTVPDGVRVAAVVAVQAGRIELERIPASAPSPAAAREFGAALARTHAAGAPAFGAAPEGYGGELYIGRRAMPRVESSSWGEFFARGRVEPFLDVAVAAGNLREGDAAIVRRACGVVADGAFDDDRPAARIHGDLWSGNVLWSPDGVVLIDPAAHGGHPETDLAMLHLFGCPFLEEVTAGYESESPLRAGWRDRIQVHQLHPLAVHAAGHGPHYGGALADAARRTLELAR